MLKITIITKNTKENNTFVLITHEFPSSNNNNNNTIFLIAWDNLHSQIAHTNHFI